MNVRLIFPALMLITALTTGCTTLADAKKGEGTGDKVTYQASFEEVWAAMPKAVEAAGLQFVAANREERSVLAQRAMTAFSYGENVAVFVQPVNNGASSVEVVSKAALKTNITARRWATPIFKELDKLFKRS